MTELTPDLWARIADNSPDGILVCDPKGRRQLPNRAGALMTKHDGRVANNREGLVEHRPA